MSDSLLLHEESHLQERTARDRFFELDALRGLAAVCVVLHHFRRAFHDGGEHVSAKTVLIQLLASGGRAVVLFFVLSGFVLSIPFFRSDSLSYALYLLRRFCRIYLPFLMALALSWVAARHFLYSHLPLSPWFYLTWQSPLTWRLLGRELLMDRPPKLNTAFWSLRYEVEMSVLLPAICFMMKGKKVWMNVACIAGVYVLGAHLPVPELVDTFTFGVAFMLGALISLYHGELKGYYGRLSGLKKSAVLAVGLAGYYAGVLPVLQRHKADTASTAIGSCVLILFALNSTLASRILRHAVPEYLGRISYSLYLVHGTVLFVLLNLLYGRVSNAGLFVIYLGVATALAHLFCLCVEEPTMRLGKRLSEHLRQR